MSQTRNSMAEMLVTSRRMKHKYKIHIQTIFALGSLSYDEYPSSVLF